MRPKLRGLCEDEWRVIGSAIGTIGNRRVREGLAEDVKCLIQQKYGTVGGRLHSYDWDEWRRICRLDESSGENSN